MAIEKNVKSKMLQITKILNNSNLKKSGFNKFLHFSYYELKDFLPLLYSLCAKFSLFIKIDIEQNRSVLYVTDIETGEVESFQHFFHTDLKIITDKMDPIQREGCISTYMRRYLLINAFGIIEPDILDALPHDEELKNYKANTEAEISLLVEKQIEDMKKQGISKKRIQQIFDFLKAQGITSSSEVKNILLLQSLQKLRSLYKNLIAEEKRIGEER